jgi:hypothetical protein
MPVLWYDAEESMNKSFTLPILSSKRHYLQPPPSEHEAGAWMEIEEGSLAGTRSWPGDTTAIACFFPERAV